MSWLSAHVFDPIRAAIARAQTSSNPVAAASATAAAATYDKIATDVQIGPDQPLTSNSAVALGNTAVKDLEDGLLEVVDVGISAALGMTGPVGVALSPVAVQGANITLTFLEQHAMTYVASLFSHAKAQVAALPAPKS